MTLVPNNQSFSTGASGVIIQSLTNTWRTQVDTVLLGMGRNITIHLQPSKTACTSSDCVFNSFYKRYMGTDGKVCSDCRGQGFILEPRQTVYMANIRWTNDPYNGSNSTADNSIPGRFEANFVRTKTVQESYSDIKSAAGATIDGINVELHDEPRYSGFGGQLFYVTTFWKATNK